MAVDIPENEPDTLRAGDTWKWTRTLADYPASAWTLKYRFKSAAGGFELEAILTLCGESEYKSPAFPSLTVCASSNCFVAAQTARRSVSFAVSPTGFASASFALACAHDFGVDTQRVVAEFTATPRRRRDAA